MGDKKDFERVMFWAFLGYVMLLPMSLVLLYMGDWWFMALTSGVVGILSVVDALVEGHETRRKQRG